MESQNVTNPEEKVRSALSSKWSKLTNIEVKDIVKDHNKLSGALKKSYSMSIDKAQKESAAFFKPFEQKNDSGIKN